MAFQKDIIGDENYIPLLDYGFVGVIDTMGDDASFVQAARVSYGKGTKSILKDRGLIRYLLRHKHTSCFEMAEIKFHIKMPIFVARQIVRHRTANINEVSYRYSEIEDEFYYPDEKVIQPQSNDNKQGRSGSIDEKNKKGVLWIFKAAYEHGMNAYQVLIGNKNKTITEDFYDVYQTEDSILDEDFEGVARELARCVIPVGAYTECYWKIDIHNLMHFMRLRQDPHAQYEVRVYADAMYELAKTRFPLAMEAYDDYVRSTNTYNLSRMDLAVLEDFVMSNLGYDDWYNYLIKVHETEKNIALHYGMTEREFRELKQRVFKK